MVNRPCLHWVQYGFPDNWLTQINDRGTAALLDVSTENPTSYQKIRTEWLCLLNGNERDFILPFAAFNDEVDLGGNYRKLQRLVDSALAGEVSSAAKHPSGKHKALLAEANGLSGEDYFRHVAALLTPLQRDERQNMSLALALCNLRQFSEAYQTLPEQVTEP